MLGNTHTEKIKIAGVTIRGNIKWICTGVDGDNTLKKKPLAPKKEKMSLWSRCLEIGRCKDKSNKITLFWLVGHESDMKINEENQNKRPDNLGQLFFFSPKELLCVTKKWRPI